MPFSSPTPIFSTRSAADLHKKIHVIFQFKTHQWPNESRCGYKDPETEGVFSTACTFSCHGFKRDIPDHKINMPPVVSNKI